MRMSTRSATHAGTWYNGNASRLRLQIEGFFEDCSKGDNSIDAVKGARVLIGPHAGYTYSGARLAETFKVWDTSKVKRVFVLGPSHHVYFKGFAMVSNFDYFETPLGNLKIDKEVVENLVDKSSTGSSKACFRYMPDEVDEEEHSIEMHAPYIYYSTEQLPQGMPSIVPIVISALDDHLNENLVRALSPYFESEENTFIISSDFCHWGSRFNYTAYLSKLPEGHVKSLDIVYLLRLRINSLSVPIYKAIEYLDKDAMKIASTGSLAQWKKYISTTENTICGQKPFTVVLMLLEELKKKQPQYSSSNFKWVGYSQSSQVTSVLESSVSYAAGYVNLVRD